MRTLITILILTLHLQAQHAAIRDLQTFLSTDQNQEQLQNLFTQLNSPDFNTRQNALETLSNIPVLPPQIIKKFPPSTNPEVRARIQTLLRSRELNDQTTNLEDILLNIHLAKDKGALPDLIQLIRDDTWKPNPILLTQAAHATLTPADAPLIQKSLTDPNPAIRDLAKDLQKTKQYTPTTISLHNGKNLDGWIAYEAELPADKPKGWFSANGQLTSIAGFIGEIRTIRRFKNYQLNITYKVDQENGDGGIGIFNTAKHFNIEPIDQKSIYLEAQLEPANPGDLWCLGGFQAMSKSPRNGIHIKTFNKINTPANQWHELKIVVKNGQITIFNNNNLTNKAKSDVLQPSCITIRNEGHKITYKQILITPLP